MDTNDSIIVKIPAGLLSLFLTRLPGTVYNALPASFWEEITSDDPDFDPVEFFGLVNILRERHQLAEVENKKRAGSTRSEKKREASQRTVKKAIEAKRNKPVSEETRAKMRLAQQARRNKEHRQTST